MAGSHVSFSYEGIGEMLRSEMMEAEMLRRIGRVRERAVALAPVGNPRRDPHSGRYKASFSVTSTRRGGFKHDRAEATLSNNSPEAFYVEYGTSRQAGKHVLRNALDAAGD